MRQTRMAIETLSNTLQSAARFVKSADDGFLILGWRNRIWDELMNQCKDTSLFRWQALECAVAYESLDQWSREEAIPREYADLPQRALRLATAAALEEITRQHAEGQFYVLEREVDTLRMGMTNWVSFAPETCLEALRSMTAWGPEFLGDYDAIDEESDVRDVHYLACYDYCGTAWLPARKRAYWLHWLSDLLPAVLRQPVEIRNMLNTLRSELN